MHRTFAYAATLFAAASAVPPLPASAQITPGDTGAGTQLGMTAENDSGEVGTITLFERGPSSTLVVIRLASEPPGRQQPALVDRGHDCDRIDPKPAYGLAPVVDGLSKTIVTAPAAKLLSGNYVANVRASSQNARRSVACGELHQ
jgi:hypothetical protein